ncbi:MAG TPA: nitrogenase-stabilizing/protective protein NifW [Rhodocyclaceae bacterium]
MSETENKLQAELADLSSAEDFFDYFALPYDRAILNVSRLHILKRFNQYIAKAGGIDSFAPREAYGRCREYLAQAYRDFLTSSGIEEKIFRVFQQAQGVQTVSLDTLRRA